MSFWEEGGPSSRTVQVFKAYSNSGVAHQIAVEQVLQKQEKFLGAID